MGGSQQSRARMGPGAAGLIGPGIDDFWPIVTIFSDLPFNLRVESGIFRALRARLAQW